MLGYPFINEMNRAILALSDAIKGRFYIVPQLSDMNNSSLDEAIDVVKKAYDAKMYPMAIMMPPVSSGSYGSRTSFKDHFNFSIYFLKVSGVTSTGQIQKMNKMTGQTMHTVVEDWHDMRRAAINYMQVLRDMVTSNKLDGAFILSDKIIPTMTPVSTIGNDKASGVLLQYAGIIQGSCTNEDYPSDYLSRIDISAVDTHPKHSL